MASMGLADADVARFAAAIPRDKLASDEDLGALLGGFVDRARARFPEIVLDDATLLDALVEKLPTWASVREAVSGLDAGELYLACGCERGDPRAIACFERTYFPVIAAALAPMSLPSGADDEIRQRVRTKLLVAEGSDRPKLRTYAGQGALGNLVRVIAVRMAISTVRESRRDVQVDHVDVVHEILAIDVSPELQLVKQRYREPFKQAFERAIEELSPRERTLLKLHVLERSSIDAIGALYKVHRATAARWLEAIRDKLGERTRAILTEQLKLDPSELESVVRAVQSQVSVTLSGLLD
jgi:RNA polymerase sigma-70 factor (ECF subfamily)